MLHRTVESGIGHAIMAAMLRAIVMMSGLCAFLLVTGCMTPEEQAHRAAQKQQKREARIAACSTDELVDRPVQISGQYDIVWPAVLAAANDVGLLVRNADKDSGYVFAQTPVDGFARGERERVDVNIQVVSRGEDTILRDAAAVANIWMTGRGTRKRFRRALRAHLVAAGVATPFVCG